MDRTALARGVGIVAAATLAVTVAFIGLLALASGDTSGLTGRFPLYVLVFAGTFTALVIGLERYLDAGQDILVSALALSVTVAVVVALDIEGLLYVAANPDELVASRLFVYLLAAGCLCTGLVYWAVNHWREFTAEN